MLLDSGCVTKQVAWNRVAFKIPKAWEIESLDYTHLIISEDGSPQLEIKWTESPRSFTLEKHIKKFISRSQKLLNIKICEQPSPDFFSHPFPGFDFFFFSWESPSSKGIGTLIFCSHCRRVTLVRFFLNMEFTQDSILHLVLTSFIDHPTTWHVPWHLFGMQFSTPVQFMLSEYSFKPGYFFVKLVYHKIHLTVLSWGPASFLLSGKTLAEFAKDRVPGLKGSATAGIFDQGSCLEWSYRQGPFKNAELLPFFSRYMRYTLFRLLQDTQNNRIYGVKIDSPATYEIELMKGTIIHGS